MQSFEHKNLFTRDGVCVGDVFVGDVLDNVILHRKLALTCFFVVFLGGVFSTSYALSLFAFGKKYER